MLVLHRKAREEVTLTIGDTVVTVSVLQCVRGRVKLGISAPRTVKISRAELAAHATRDRIAQPDLDE